MLRIKRNLLMMNWISIDLLNLFYSNIISNICWTYKSVMRMHHQTTTTFNDAVTYYFRNVVVGRASFSALDDRKREKKKEKREKAVGVPLAATKFPVAMADITSIGRALFSFFVLHSTDRKRRRIMKCLWPILSLTSKEGLLSLVYMCPFVDLCFFPLFSKICCVVVCV